MRRRIVNVLRFDEMLSSGAPLARVLMRLIFIIHIALRLPVEAAG